jgi:cytochrome c553
MNRAIALLVCCCTTLLASSLASAQAPAAPAESSGAASTPAAAPEAAATPAVPAKPDLQKGAAIAAAVCAACHTIDGNGTGPAFPKLAGQNAQYLVKQLNDFKVIPPAKTALRPNAIMSPIAAALGEADMVNVATYYEGQKLKPADAKNPATAALGMKIWRGGIAERGVPACGSCHGPAGAGIPIEFPALGGQWQDYLEMELGEFKSGARQNSVPMTTISSRLSDSEMKAVADYAAGLR